MTKTFYDFYDNRRGSYMSNGYREQRGSGQRWRGGQQSIFRPSNISRPSSSNDWFKSRMTSGDTNECSRPPTNISINAPVVIDNGTGYMKIGFGGTDPNPLKLVPSFVSQE